LTHRNCPVGLFISTPARYLRAVNPIIQGLEGIIMKKRDLSKVFEESIIMEEKGYSFYTEGAEKIKNSLGRRMLLRLAEDEQIHIKKIKEIYRHLTEGSMETMRPESHRSADFNEIFERMKNDLQGAIGDSSVSAVEDEEIIQIALELESHARFFYEKAAKLSDDRRVKQFYELLAAEEKNHYDLLQKTHSFMENPSLFFGMGYH
jgi:rubrerythrin